MGPIIRKYAVLDFETTGAESHDRIIQVGLTIVEDGLITQTYSSFVRPGIPIPDVIRRLTGIEATMVSDAPELDDVLIEMLPLLSDAILVAHNAIFDLGFLQRALLEAGYEPYNGRVLDTIHFLRFLYPGLSSLSLGRACHALNIPHERHHQADSDAQATANLWLHCLERVQNLPLLTVQRLAGIFAVTPMFEDIVWFLQEIERDKEIRSDVIEGSDHYYRQLYLKVNDWNDEEDEIHRSIPADYSEGEGGFVDFYDQFKPQLQNKFKRFEEREGQDQMIHEVHRTFTEGQHLMIEAGTGTGKSLGYLIPSVYYSVLNEEKVVISTHTINLQEQIRQRDIPLLQELFPFPFKAAVLKGRSHYLCLRKFENKVNTSDFENPKEDPITAAQMVVWLGQTNHGDEEEIHFANKGKDFWRSVESDTDSCLNRACPWFKKCFYHRARHEANVADIVITNHSLLFTDVKAENRILPAYRYLVIDEAHQFEETASKHLGIEVGYYTMVKALTWLYKDNRSGLLPQLIFRLQRQEEDDSREAAGQLEAMIPEVIKVREEWDQLTDRLYGLLSTTGDASSEVGQHVLRLKKDSFPSGWNEVHTLEDNIYVRLTDILKLLERISGELKESQDKYDLQSLLTDMNGSMKDLFRLRDQLRFILHCDDKDQPFVFWLEAHPYYRSKSLQLVGVPIDVSPMLQNYFFENKESVVLTSATLSVEKSFQYACDQLGLQSSLDTNKLRTVQLPSAFNYREQALVIVPRDFPSVKGSGDPVFLEALARSLTEVAIETKGRMLVLFTSHRMLKQIHEMIRNPLAEQGIQLLGQGMDSTSRSKLIHLFQEQTASVLLGTSSFWEGVDIPGQALSCLAIVRLPFQPPNHPLVEAKNDALKRMNKNPFMKLSVPQAVIRFKQGFGRLVRTSQDKGIVIIYDTRVIDTSYGKYFLYSLPGPKIEHLPTDQLVPRIQDWMKLDSEIYEREGEIVL
ncbi:MAG: ATP-dependent DNA helicase DinG [Paenibacillaceae bacterium]